MSNRGIDGGQGSGELPDVPKHPILNRMAVVAAVLVAVPWTVFMAAATGVGFLIHESVGHWVHRFWARVVCLLGGIHIRVKGLERIPYQKGCVIAPNHESLVDILVLASLPVNFRWISKKEVQKFPLVGWGMHKMGCYFLDRHNTNQDLEIMKQVEADLRTGTRVVIFPEGTRTRTGEILPLKKGAFKTAQNAGVPVCPVGIRGTRDIVPARGLPRRWGHTVHVQFGQPWWIAPALPIDTVLEDFRKELIRLRES